MTHPIAVTAGEPAGIGPDILLMTAMQPQPVPLVAIADRDLLADRARSLNLDIRLVDAADPGAATTGYPAGTLAVRHCPLRRPVTAGQLDPHNAPYVLETLDIAIAGCLSGEYAAMVTCPLQKSVINDAGIPFSGHTEYLAEKTGTPRVVMLLAAGGLRVALATTHLPLADVPAAITRDSLTATLRILHADMQRRFGIPAPRIAVLGLNPHAGEGGHLGREEIETIAPVLETLRSSGMSLIGPLPADTAFTPRALKGVDTVLAMYHDQGLPVLKYAGFGSAVNITLGLPIVRTSVDHGTALDLAGKGTADAGSLAEAISQAVRMAKTG
ncbi:4-hydroxythreonine-4-phosphate dehydrogenase PdxA [Chromatocurvus halotolerans]|uniref:4-hydroxythreonine-4-phosphate dehydrogenase n=1 Tax=Chromatocurvus halotolerans TaxID=1132028 RepID=A0A4R2KP56_9GAMM|nr:4-hydroxythreonine-4-phosphate dehydrogenase PdxA [Chromatocurvus halotolerans]TCO71848.1 4-hydroxythreonine-4-phosphate dehydrogenase [Chromatocurvus halotolerans]